MPGVDEAVGEERDDPLDAPVARGRHGNQTGLKMAILMS